MMFFYIKKMGNDVFVRNALLSETWKEEDRILHVMKSDFSSWVGEAEPNRARRHEMDAEMEENVNKNHKN